MSHRRSRYTIVAGLVLSCAHVSLGAPPLYGISFTSTQGSVLYEVNPLNGQASAPKSTGLDHIVGITFGPAGWLYGLTNATAQTYPNSLVRIDRDTGSSQLVGSTGLDAIVEGDLAWDSSTGSFYGLYSLSGGARKLFTLSPTTGGAMTLPISLAGDPSAMAFNAAGSLYVIDTSLAKLLTVDKATGATLTTISLSRSLGSVAGMAVDPLTGTFYVVDGDSAGTDHLYTLNPATGFLTDKGATGLPDGLGGLAFLPEPASLLLIGFGAAMFHASRKQVVR